MSYGDFSGRLAMAWNGAVDILYPTGSGASGTDNGVTTTVGDSLFVTDPNRKCIIHSVTYSSATTAGLLTITDHLSNTFTWAFGTDLAPNTADLCVPIMNGGFKVQTTGQAVTFVLVYTLV